MLLPRLPCPRDGALSNVRLYRKGVHLFLNYVCGVAHAALKKLGMLKNGCAHFVKAVVFGYLAHCRFNILGFVAVLGQQIESTLMELVISDISNILSVGDYISDAQGA